MHFDYPSDSSVFALVALDYCPSFGLAANQLADQEERKEKISYGVLILRTICDHMELESISGGKYI